MIEFLESDATRWDPASLNRLKYRRQFAFGPRPLVLDGAWRTHQVGRDWFFTVHEDLPFYSGQNSGGAILVLLGFLIDADRPHLGDAELVQELTQYSDWDQVLRATANYSGRWAVFHIEPDRVRVVNDAAGLRSVFFLTEGHEPWCFSQPGLYRSIQPASYSDSAVEFIYSRQSQKDVEAWWPGSSSPFAEVEHLLPNHYLDLTARTTARFWPHESLEPLDPETAVSVSAGILQNSFAAMAARRPHRSGTDVRLGQSNLARRRPGRVEPGVALHRHVRGTKRSERGHSDPFGHVRHAGAGLSCLALPEADERAIKDGISQEQ